MNKENKMIENKFNRLLNLLREQEIPTANVPAQAQKVNPGPGPGAQQSQQQQQTQQPKQIALGKAQVDKGTKIQYLSTINMFTSKTPPDSAEWQSQIKEKSQFSPLSDARIVNEIKKFFPAMKAISARAAKYSDYQFRIVLSGGMRAAAAIKITTKDDEAFATLEKINIEVAGGISSSGSSEIINTMKEENKIPIKANLKDIRSWAQTESPKKQEKNKEAEIKKEQSGPVSPTKAKENYAKLPQMRQLTYSPTIDQIKQSPDPRPSKKTKLPTGHKYYETLISMVQNMWEVKPSEAKRFARAALKDKDPKNEVELVKLSLNKKYFSGETEKSKNESFNLSSYIRTLMLERNSDGELETGKGGDFVASLNDNLFSKWFRNGGIAASGRNKIFMGNIFEWFAVDKAVFVPKERKAESIDKKEVEVTMIGEIKMDSEIWIDARIGENNRGLSSWSFRILDGGKEKVFSKKIFSTQRLSKKIEQPAELEEPAEQSTEPTVNKSKTAAGVDQI